MPEEGVKPSKKICCLETFYSSLLERQERILVGKHRIRCILGVIINLINVCRTDHNSQKLATNQRRNKAAVMV